MKRHGVFITKYREAYVWIYSENHRFTVKEQFMCLVGAFGSLCSVLWEEFVNWLCFWRKK